MRISDWSSDVCSSDLPGAGVDAPHVIDDQGQGQLAQERYQLGEAVGVEMDHRMPAERDDFLDDGADGAAVGVGAEVADEVEAHAAHAAFVERRKASAVISACTMAVPR